MERLGIGRGDELLRGDAFLDPTLKREDCIMLRIERHRGHAGLSEIHRPRSAGAMIHARHHEEAIEVAHALKAAVRSNHSLEVVDRTPGEDQLVSPTVISDHLSAMTVKMREMGVVRADDLVKLLLRIPEALREAGNIQGMPIEAG